MSQIKVNTINDASGGSAAVLYGVASPPNSMGFRNRLINSDMRIDQRNAGASVTLTAANDVYPVDRFGAYASTDGTMTAQQSSTAPAGFSKSVVFTTTVADSSLAAAQRCTAFQRIEGYNVADLGFGAVGAQSVTLSFWVRSSLTGTFGASLIGASYGRSYPFTYTITAANTWEQKTVTIAGDTSGTWLTTNGVGLVVAFSLGVGSNFVGTANTWQNGEFFTPSGTTSVIGTSGATFYITGVQLEAGTVASPFERRDYGRELMMCQRYLNVYGGTASSTALGVGQVEGGGTAANVPMFFPTTMRSAPTLTYQGSLSDITFNRGGSGGAVSSIAIGLASPYMTNVVYGISGGTAGYSVNIYTTASTVKVLFSSEL